jgi:hypothetical protein
MGDPKAAHHACSRRNPTCDPAYSSRQLRHLPLIQLKLHIHAPHSVHLFIQVLQSILKFFRVQLKKMLECGRQNHHQS